jgi:hypothetical protein
MWKIGNTYAIIIAPIFASFRRSRYSTSQAVFPNFTGIFGSTDLSTVSPHRAVG